MGIKVITYNHSRKWKSHKAFNLIKNEIHISATKNVAEGIKELYRSDEKGEFQYIFTIHQLMSRVFHPWYQANTVLEQYLTLSRIISETSGERLLLDAFKKNTYELLKTIRLLIFCGVTPYDMMDFTDLTPKEDMFLDVWKKFIKKELEFKDENDPKKRSGLQRLLLRKKKRFNKTFINKRLNRILAARYRKGEDIPLELPLETDKKIVLHGFYFITPNSRYS